MEVDRPIRQAQTHSPQTRKRSNSAPPLYNGSLPAVPGTYHQSNQSGRASLAAVTRKRRGSTPELSDGYIEQRIKKDQLAQEQLTMERLAIITELKRKYIPHRLTPIADTSFSQDQLSQIKLLFKSKLNLDDGAPTDKIFIVSEDNFEEVMGYVAIIEFLDDQKANKVANSELAAAFEETYIAGKAKAATTKGITCEKIIYIKEAFKLGVDKKPDFDRPDTSSMLETIIHESSHEKCNDYFQKHACQGKSNGINEGVTEYFARKVKLGFNKSYSRNAYGQEVGTVEKLDQSLGGDLLFNAYYHGSPNSLSALREAYLNKFGIRWDDDFEHIQLTCRLGGKIVPVNEDHRTDTLEQKEIRRKKAMEDEEESGISW